MKPIVKLISRGVRTATHLPQNIRATTTSRNSWRDTDTGTT